MKSQKFDTTNIEDLCRLAADTARAVSKKTLWLLSGDLGAGKTRFVEAAVNELGGGETSSPTFVLHQIYSTRIGDVHHFDLYRLETASDLESTGFWDVFQADAKLVIVEWAERLGEISMPPGWQISRMHFRVESSGRRSVEITPLSI